MWMWRTNLVGAKIPLNRSKQTAAWQEAIPFFAFLPAVQKINITTNTIESLNQVIRKITKIRGNFPTDDAAIKLVFFGNS